MNGESASTVRELLRQVSDRLGEAGIASPGTDAVLILAHVLRVSRGRVEALAILGSEIADRDADAVRELAQERARRVPLQHLTGTAPFRRLELAVGPGVFIPRPETEGVAQLAIDALSDPGHEAGEPFAVDLCTGSGAIALSLADEVPGVRVWAIEKSREAYAWADRNVAAHGAGRVQLMLGDAADARTLLPAEILGRVRVLVSNPPYVPDDMVPRDPEVRDHDPGMALYGGADGLDLIRVISRVARDIVETGGSLVIEHAEAQGDAIRALLTGDGWIDARTHEDFTGRDRATTAVR